MSAGSWGEADAVEAWLTRVGVFVKLTEARQLAEAVTKFRLEQQARAEAAEARVAELEQKLRIVEEQIEALGPANEAQCRWEMMREWLVKQAAGWHTLFDGDPRDRWRHREIACDEALEHMAKLEAGEVKP